MLDAALSTGLAYEEWFQREVLKGLSDLDAGRVVSHEQVRRNMARRKAAFVRSLAKAA
ncbi:MAG: CopG family transcriptional regulator [Betaproteobacteria bacterium]